MHTFKNYPNNEHERDTIKELEEQIRAVANELCKSIELEKIEKQLEKFNRTILHKSLANINYKGNSHALLIPGDLFLSSLLKTVSYFLTENETDDCTRTEVKQFLTTISNGMNYKIPLWKSNKVIINLESYTSGVYLVTVYDDLGGTTKKIVKQ